MLAGNSDGADRFNSGLFDDGGAQVCVRQMQENLLGLPPFAPAYRRLTYRMVDFAQNLAKVMCLSDVANLTGLDWDRVKDVVKERLEEDFGRPDLGSSGKLGLLNFN